MISHLKQYIIDKMTCSYKIVCIFLLCTVRYIIFGINVISRLSGLTYKNIEKWQITTFIGLVCNPTIATAYFSNMDRVAFLKTPGPIFVKDRIRLELSLGVACS